MKPIIKLFSLVLVLTAIPALASFNPPGYCARMNAHDCNGQGVQDCFTGCRQQFRNAIDDCLADPDNCSFFDLAECNNLCATACCENN